MPTTPTQSKQNSQLQAAVAAAVAAKTAPLEGGVAAPYLAAAGVSIEAVRGAISRALTVGAVLSIVAALRYARMLRNTNEPGPPSEDEVSKLIAEERRFALLYAEKAAERIVADLEGKVERALERLKVDSERYSRMTKEEKDVFHRDLLDIYRWTIEAAVARENRFYGTRMDAVGKRVSNRSEEMQVKADSPEGAYWLLNVALKTHTPDCVAMSNKAWNWAVLSIVSPSTRHFGCGCSLIPLSIARAAAMPNSDKVRNVAPAIAINAPGR